MMATANLKVGDIKLVFCSCYQKIVRQSLEGVHLLLVWFHLYASWHRPLRRSPFICRIYGDLRPPCNLVVLAKHHNNANALWLKLIRARFSLTQGLSPNAIWLDVNRILKPGRL